MPDECSVVAMVRFIVTDVHPDTCPYDTAQDRLHRLFEGADGYGIEFEWLEGVSDECDEDDADGGDA